MSKLKPEPLLTIKPFSDVYISTGNGKLKPVLKKGFDALGGIQKFVKPGQSVLLKPNLTAGADPSTGGTTDARFCEAVAELIIEHCSPGQLYLGENTGSGNMTMNAYKQFGYVEMCKRHGIELVDFTNAERVDVEVPGALYADVISMPKVIMDVDVFITLPILKNHDTVCITAAVKNSFGLVEQETRTQAHRDDAIEQYLVDIGCARSPDFSIVDGRIGMEGVAGGAYFDRPRFANRIIMGADPVAVDVVCTHVMEQNPRVRYLQWADERGLGNCNLDYINIHGMPLEEAKVAFMSPAGQFEEQSSGKLRLHDLGSCSRCRAVAQGTLHRFHTPESIIGRVDIVYGSGEWDVPDDLYENCILVGNCINKKYRAMGTWIPGCPMSRDDYFKALNDMDIVCSKCEQAVNRFMANHTPEELSFVRILSSNKTVFQGAFNRSQSTDFLLAVGDCQQRYAGYHIRRGRDELIQRGIADKVDAGFFVMQIPGHEPTVEALEEAFAELKKRETQWKNMQPTLTPKGNG
ncbi:MAG: DUF362 domain-containing protein [Oscillospiraceae bacterium]|nr:DUF362 domain-containing protein [Oscillospiraceae bacterium]